MAATSVANLFVRCYTRLCASPLDLSERTVGTVRGIYSALIKSKAFLEADQFAALSSSDQRRFRDVLLSTRPFTGKRAEYAGNEVLHEVLQSTSPMIVASLVEGAAPRDKVELNETLKKVEANVTTLFKPQSRPAFLSLRNHLELREWLTKFRNRLYKESAAAEFFAYLYENLPATMHAHRDDLKDILPRITEFDAAMTEPDEISDEQDQEKPEGDNPEEKWDDPVSQPTNKRGRYADMTVGELKKALKALQKGGPVKKGGRDYKKMKVLQFAIRAKKDWGDVASIQQHDNPIAEGEDAPGVRDGTGPYAGRFQAAGKACPNEQDDDDNDDEEPMSMVGEQDDDDYLTDVDDEEPMEQDDDEEPDDEEPDVSEADDEEKPDDDEEEPEDGEEEACSKKKKEGMEFPGSEPDDARLRWQRQQSLNDPASGTKFEQDEEPENGEEDDTENPEEKDDDEIPSELFTTPQETHEAKLNEFEQLALSVKDKDKAEKVRDKANDEFGKGKVGIVELPKGGFGVINAVELTDAQWKSLKAWASGKETEAVVAFKRRLRKSPQERFYISEVIKARSAAAARFANRNLALHETMDEDAITELQLFIANDSDLYRQQYQPILKNLMTKKGQGRYDSELAVKLFMYLVDNGAKKYAKEYGSSDVAWNVMFPKMERLEVARRLRNKFEEEAALGAYDNFLPAKYRKESRVYRATRLFMEQFADDPNSALNQYWKAAAANDPKTGKPVGEQDEEPQDGEEPAEETDTGDMPADAPADVREVWPKGESVEAVVTQGKNTYKLRVRNEDWEKMKPTLKGNPGEAAKILESAVVRGEATKAIATKRESVATDRTKVFQVTSAFVVSAQEARRVLSEDHISAQLFQLHLEKNWSGKLFPGYVLENAGNAANYFVFCKAQDAANLVRFMEGLGFAMNGVEEKYNKYGKITAGMMNAMGRGMKAHTSCNECGMLVPVYAGRYPKACPNCGGLYASVKKERITKRKMRRQHESEEAFIDVLDADSNAVVQVNDALKHRGIPTSVGDSSFEGKTRLAVRNTQSDLRQAEMVFKELTGGMDNAPVRSAAKEGLVRTEFVLRTLFGESLVEAWGNADYYMVTITQNDVSATDVNDLVNQLAQATNGMGFMRGLDVLDDAGPNGVTYQYYFPADHKSKVMDVLKGVSSMELGKFESTNFLSAYFAGRKELKESHAPAVKHFDAACRCWNCKAHLAENRKAFMRLLEQEPVTPSTATPAKQGATVPATVEEPTEGSPTDSKSEPAKEPEKPEEVKPEEKANGFFKCPACGAEIPADAMQTVLASFLQQIAAQLQQNANGEEKTAKEEPKAEEPPKEAAPAAPAEQPAQESRNRKSNLKEFWTVEPEDAAEAMEIDVQSPAGSYLLLNSKSFLNRAVDRLSKLGYNAVIGPVWKSSEGERQWSVKLFGEIAESSYRQLLRMARLMGAKLVMESRGRKARALRENTVMPTPAELLPELQQAQTEIVDGNIEVRLQLRPEGWLVLSGDVDPDEEPSEGHWGAVLVTDTDTDEDLLATAQDLIDAAQDDMMMSDAGEVEEELPVEEMPFESRRKVKEAAIRSEYATYLIDKESVDALKVSGIQTLESLVKAGVSDNIGVVGAFEPVGMKGRWVAVVSNLALPRFKTWLKQHSVPVIESRTRSLKHLFELSNRVWDRYEQYKEMLGVKRLLEEMFRQFSSTEARETLDWIARHYDLDDNEVEEAASNADWDRMERYAEIVGEEKFLDEVFHSLSDKEATEALDFIGRMHDIEESKKRKRVRFIPIPGELSVRTESIPANEEISVLDWIGEKAVVAYNNVLHEVPAENVYVFPKGYSLSESMKDLQEGRATKEEIAARRLHCRTKAKRLVDITEASVKSDATFVVAYLPDLKSFKLSLVELKRHGTVSPVEDGRAVIVYPNASTGSRTAIVSIVEKHKGRVIQSRVPYLYDPNKPLSEQLGDEATEVNQVVQDLFTAGFEKLKSVRQIYVDLLTGAIQKSIALLQGEGKGKKTIGALQKLAGSLDIEDVVKEITKQLDAMNKAHDIFTSEFGVKDAEKPEVGPAPEVPATPPATEPAPAPASAPAPEAPQPAEAPAESAIVKAVAQVKKHKDWALLEAMFEHGTSYAKVAAVVRSILPHFDAKEVHAVVHRLV